MEWTQGRDLCFRVLDLAKKAGADAADLILERGQSFSLNALAGKIDKSKVTSTQIIGLRLLKNKKVGIAVSESLLPASLERMVAQALSTSQFSGEDLYQTMREKPGDEQIFCPEFMNYPDSAAVAAKVGLAIELEAGVKAAHAAVQNAPYSGYADGFGESFYADHEGTFRYHKERSFSCYTSALAAKDAVQTMYSGSSIARRFEDLDAPFCIQKSVETALALLEAKAIPTGRYDVVFEIDEWESLVSAHLGAFSAKAAMEGTAYYRGKLGQSIADAALTLRDCPQYASAFSWSAYDDEGFAKRDLTLIERGVLREQLHNSSTARYFAVANTGRGARGARGSLGTSTSNIVIEAGQAEESGIWQGKVLKIISLKGLHSGTNAISGFFSLAIEGILMQDGQPLQYVKDVTLSGNFYEMLSSPLLISKTQQASSSRSFFSPSIRFAKLSVAGA